MLDETLEDNKVTIASLVLDEQGTNSTRHFRRSRMEQLLGMTS